MKYSKKLKQDLQSIPSTWREKCISYKIWKKRCNALMSHFQDAQDAIAALNAECAAVDKYFCSLYRQWLKSRNSTCCNLINALCSVMTTRPHDEMHFKIADILNYATINAMTTYKICKKIQKGFKTRDSLAWLTETRALHTYAYMGSRHLTHLNLVIKHSIECPICMEEDKSELLVFQCGHFACTKCTLEYAGVHKMNGTWFNLLKYAHKKECPFCRYSLALDDVLFLA
jgi:hypothetical protein